MAKQRKKECAEYSVNTKDKVCETSYKFNKIKPKNQEVFKLTKY